MDKFKLVSNYKPTGDQPQAVETLANSILPGSKEQTPLGVTGSGIRSNNNCFNDLTCGDD